MTDQTGLNVTVADGIATITICQPERKNALTKPMWGTLAHIAQELSDDLDLRCVVIRGGDGAGFGAGADIHEFVRERDGFNKARDYGLLHAEALQMLQACPHPVIAAIDGPCIGASFVLAAACDLRIAADNAKFAVPPMKLGATLGYPELQIMLDLLGEAALFEILLEGQVFGPARAREIGFIARYVPIWDFEGEITKTAQRIASGAPITQRLHKKMINRLRQGGAIDAHEFDEGYRAFDSADFKEGYTAFLEKRKAVFSGK
ncbi:enoyl-CoA hydratase/isomerase family protein [Thalassospira lucentensis]|uniref:enoyl-CoA hydratase/isomerase family protein n=1 Tax=Thalassospira lucentensis TaxID=168935 RepID=UPI00142DBEA9|nr:enoyl-CoA hydratase-related protein [Thalassospira lucentensis]NIZ03670.1 enoyl-CoA hydratase [Thalassospira lucentensis]